MYELTAFSCRMARFKRSHDARKVQEPRCKLDHLGLLLARNVDTDAERSIGSLSSRPCCQTPAETFTLGSKAYVSTWGAEGRGIFSGGRCSAAMILQYRTVLLLGGDWCNYRVVQTGSRNATTESINLHECFMSGGLSKKPRLRLGDESHQSTSQDTITCRFESRTQTSCPFRWCSLMVGQYHPCFVRRGVHTFPSHVQGTGGDKSRCAWNNTGSRLRFKDEAHRRRRDCT